MGLFLTLITLDLLSRQRSWPSTYPPCKAAENPLQQLALGFFLIFLLRDWSYFYALDLSKGGEEEGSKTQLSRFQALRVVAAPLEVCGRWDLEEPHARALRSSSKIL